MEEKWICPQCETVNENTEKCIVCSMTYKMASEVYKRHEEAKPVKKREVEPSKIKLNFKDEPESAKENEVVSETYTPVSVISVILGVIGILICMFNSVSGFLISAAAMICGAVAVNRKFNYTAIIGISLGIVSLILTIIGMAIYM